MIALMLHHPGMEPVHRTVYGSAIFVRPTVLDATPSRDNSSTSNSSGWKSENIINEFIDICMLIRTISVCMCVCIALGHMGRLCMYVCNYMSVYKYLCRYLSYICMYVCMYVCMCVYMYVYMYVCL